MGEVNWILFTAAFYFTHHLHMLMDKDTVCTVLYYSLDLCVHIKHGKKKKRS